MSYNAAKTNFVRPHAKTSYIRPMFCHNEKENLHKDFNTVAALKYPEFTNKEFDGCLSNPDSLKIIDESKEKHIQSLNSAHSKLYAEIDKIHNWTASVESDCKQKDKKVDELNQIIESQRKVQIDFQMQNENLSTKLAQEIHQRVSVLERYYFTKELFSTLRKKIIDLQEQFNACIKAKKAIDVYCEKNTKSVEDLIQKMNTLSVQYSENIVILNNSLKSEKNNNMMLKKLFEQQNLSAEKEHKSLCKLIENYQEEIKSFSQDLDIEKNKVLCLQQEKNELLQKIALLEKSEEASLHRLQDVEKELQLMLESKLEWEKKYSLENIKVNDLSKKIEELEELVNKLKIDFDEKCLALKTTITTLENSLSESEQKLVECESEKQELSRSSKEREKEKCSLEDKILVIEEENRELQNKLRIDAKTSSESIDLLMKEKNDLMTSVSLLKDDLQNILLEKEKLSKEYLEKEKKLLELTKEYEIAAAKIKELTLVEEKYVEMVKKVEEISTDMQLQSNLLASKEEEINEMQQLKVKYDECLIKTKEYEDNLLSISDELKMKEKKIEELTACEENLGEALIKIKELESVVISKNDLIISQEEEIKEMQQLKLAYEECLIKIKEHEDTLQSVSNELKIKELCVEEMNKIKQNYDSTVERLKEMEAVIQEKTERLQKEEEKIIDLSNNLKEKNYMLEKLEYENLEIKDCLEKELDSVKICLECDILKDKVKELDHLKTVLMDTEKELSQQKLQTSHITKMLSETEENFDEMRIKKEKEIIKYKDTIQTLQHELKILKVEVAEAEKLKVENDKLRLTIEEIKLQNVGDMQRLKSEIETLKAKEIALNPESSVPKKLVSSASSVKVKVAEAEKLKVENDKLRLTIEEIKLQNVGDMQKLKSEIGTLKTKEHEPKVEEVMEPDSSDEVTVVNEREHSKISSVYKRFSKEINRKVMNHPIRQSTPLAFLEKRKRAWESESSGSECLEVIFDKNAKKVAGFTPKIKSPHALNKTPVSSSGKFSTSQDRRRDLLEITEVKTPKKDQNDLPNVNYLTIQNTPQNKKIEQIDLSENVDFPLCKSSVKEVNTPLREQVTEIKRTPTTPVDRKFFKTPMKERDHSFKKPQLQKLWF